ncbi:hypothetical protein [Kutzneria buriramensis]|uniref:AbiTii domain-containing protein n=1 Tax=Kutzneria buriramensis TaxID=1045776 RepID=A0A3E0G5X3_9PSEU|nr:hypothetical protein [Kutzneria buriramensis]REH18307.1 hypothetical protein BCF44_13662 [Kutzneria buriramensis]
MHGKRNGLLDQLQAGVADDTTPLSSLLQKCILLGGQAGSEKMRDWAVQELNGYDSLNDLPDYRKVAATVMIQFTNLGGYNPMTRRLRIDAEIPAQLRHLAEWETAQLPGGVGELEAMATREELHLSTPWDGWLIDLLSNYIDEYSRISAIYWDVSPVVLRGVLVRIRTALAQLVAELIALTPPDQSIPNQAAADAAIQFVVTGKRATINLTTQHAEGGSTNTVTTAGAGGTAIGSQSAGDNATVVGSQAVHGDHNTVAGRDTAGETEPATKGGWWTRLRKRGVLVALATIVAGIMAVLTWLGLTPPSPNGKPPSTPPTATSSPAPASTAASRTGP